MRRALPLLLLGLAAFAQTGQQPKPLTNADVIELSRVGAPESTIILAIQKTPVKFDVSAEGILALHAAGIHGAGAQPDASCGNTAEAERFLVWCRYRHVWRKSP